MNDCHQGKHKRAWNSYGTVMLKMTFSLLLVVNFNIKNKIYMLLLQ